MRSKTKRWLLGLIAVFSLFLVFLHTSPARDTFKGILTKWATSKLGGPVHIGDLDYRLWRGEVTIRNLYLAPEKPFTFAAEGITLHWFPFTGASVRVLSPRLIVQQSPDTSLQSPGTWSGDAMLGVPRALSALELRNGSLVVVNENGQPWLELSSIEAILTSEHTGKVTSEAGSLAIGETELFFGPLKADFELQNGRLTLTDAILEKGGSSIRTSGNINALSPFVANLDIDIHLDAEDAHGLFQEWELAGEIEGEAHLVADTDGTRVDADFRSPKLSSPLFGQWAAEGELATDGSQLELTRLHLAGYECSIEASGRFDIGQERHYVEAVLSDLVIAQFGLPVASRVGGELRLELTGSRLDALDGNGRFTFTPSDDDHAIPLAGTVELSVQSGILRFESDKLNVPEGELAFEGELRQDGGMAAEYTATIEEFRRLDPLLKYAGLPEPPADLGGVLSIQGETSGSWRHLDSLSSNLTVTSDRLELKEEPFELDAKLSITGKSLELHELVIHGNEGTITARGNVSLEQQGSLELTGDVTGFEFTGLASRFRLPSGGTAHGHFQVSGDEFTASVRLDPLVVHDKEGWGYFDLRKQGRELRIERLEAKIGEGRAQASGIYHLDTDEVFARLEAHRLRLSDLVGGSARIGGIVSSMEADVEGIFPALKGRARIALDDLSLREEELPSLIVEARSNGDTVHMEARNVDEALLASGEADLVSPYPLQGILDLSAFPLDSLLRGLFPSTPEDTRLLSQGRLDVSLPLQNPKELQYRAEVDQLVGYYRGIGGGTGSTFVIEGDLKTLHIHELDLVGTDTAIAVDGKVPLVPDGYLDLNLRGDVRLELLNILVEDGELSGKASFNLHWGGRAIDPRLNGELSLENGNVSWMGLRAGALAADLEAREGRALIRRLTGEMLGGTFLITGESPLPRPSDSAPARFALSVTDVDLGELMPQDPEPAIEPLILVSTTGTFEVTGYELSNVRGTGEISMLLTSLGDIVIENSVPVPWHLDNGRLSIRRMQMSGGDTDLEINFNAGIAENAWTWQTSVNGEIDNTYINPIIQMGWDAVVWGTTKLNLEAGGSNGDIELRGEGTLDGARLVIREPSLVLTNLAGAITFDGQAITLSEITAQAGGGRVEASGNIDLGELGTLRGLDVELGATEVSLDYPSGMQSHVSGSLRLRGKPGTFLLSGNLRLLEGLFNETISLETGFTDAADRRSVTLGDDESFGETVLLDVRVQSVEDIRIDNNLVRADTGVNLRVSGSVAAPEIDGVLTVRPEGTFRLGRNLYRIESGSILMRGYPLEPAELNVTARTAVSGQDIVLRLSGDTDNVVMELDAPDEPRLTQGDIASLLLTGRTLRQVGQLETVSGREKQILEEQLVTYMGGTLANIARQGLGRALPFDQISVAPADLGSEVDPELRFSLGKALTEDLFVTYSIGLENTESQLWVVDYQLPKRLEFRGTRREDNSLSGALSQKLQLNFPGRPRQGIDPRTTTRIVAVNVVGAPSQLDERLAKTIRLGPNDRYEYWKAQEDVQRLTKALRDEGYLNAFVNLETSSSGQEAIELRYRVEPGLPVRIQWDGDDPGDSIRKKVRNAWDGRLPERFLLTELTQLAALELQRARFYNARVEAKASNASDGKREVTFIVVKGSRGEGLELEFSGNRAFTEAELIRALPPSSSVDFFALVFQDPAGLRETLHQFYVSRGYLGARIDKPTTEYDSRTGIFRVTIPIKEGPLATVSKVRFEGADSIDESRLTREVKLVEGRPFDLTAFTDTRTALASLYRRQGFTDARVRGRLDSTEDRLDVVFAVEEGLQSTVGDVRVIGNHATRESIILRQLTFESGDPLNVSELTETQRKLYDLGIFRSADIRSEPSGEDPSIRDVVIDVTEAAYLDFGYGLRYSSEDGPEILTNFRFPNLLGSAQQVGLSLTANRNDNIVRASFFTPYIWRYQLDTGLFVARETDDEVFFSTRSWRVTFQQGKRLPNQMNLQWSYTYRYGHTEEKVSSGPFPFEITTHQSILTASLIDDRRDGVVQPTRGRFWNITFQYSPKGLGSDVPFVKLFGRLFTFFPLGHDVVWAGSYRLGIADAFDMILLPDDRFQAGGPTTVRGFEQDSLGPQIPFSGGEGLVIYNQELRFPIYRWFQGVAFYDAGNVFPKASDFRLFDLRHSAGVGLRFALPFGLLRFDWGWPLDRQPGEKAFQFWFSLNHAF